MSLKEIREENKLEDGILLKMEVTDGNPRKRVNAEFDSEDREFYELLMGLSCISKLLGEPDDE